MIATALALLLAGLPEGAARYRFEISGEPVGVAELSIRCEGSSCTAVWEATSRLPAEAGGAIRRRRSTAEVDRAGRLRRGAPVAVEEGGEVRRLEARAGAVPSSIAEVVLAAEAPAHGEACADVLDDRVPRAPGRGCARREGERVLVILVPGGRLEVAPGADGFPSEVRVPEQGVRFVRDPGALVPPETPRLHGTRVPGPAVPARARSFCGIGLDPTPPAIDPSRLPPPRAGGRSCREKATDYVSRAERAGMEGRAAVGVAFDGSGFVWHAWAELRVDGEWIAVDPTFGQAPAEGPRFTVARYRPGDGAQEQAAGRRLLECWGRAEVRGREPRATRR